MVFERFVDDGLAHFSYAVGSRATGEVAVVDPRRDVDAYLEWAAGAGVRIARVLETHIHADYASGAQELARRAGASLHLSAYDANERYEVAFPHRELKDGDELELGEVRIRAVHTPGHTPEHLSFLVFEGDDERPRRFLTGDFLFIGSLGRPDLLGEAASRRLANAMYDSVRQALPGLPDDLVVHPGHGAGSMCGAGMSQARKRSLGQERRENPFLSDSMSREEFVQALLASVPPFPDYYRRMKDRNAGGDGSDRPWPEPVALGAEAFAEQLREGAVAIDTRHQLAFGGGHIPGSLSLGLTPDLSEWAGWVAPYDRPLLLVTGSAEDVAEAVTRLARVGLDRVEGYLEGGMDAWLTGGRPIRALPQVPAHEVAERRDELSVLDVRTAEEWEEGHIPGALHVMGGDLDGSLDALPDRSSELAVVCGSGYRSTVAASVLERHGFSRVRNIPGGMDAWRAAGLPVATGD